ncbi:MAG: hypothetical protein ORN20_06670, partial [Candidatus Nanopelagicales bacterium]|nr:hypothetical protein [Candidatus Nanopelagicales bacterium]
DLGLSIDRGEGKIFAETVVVAKPGTDPAKGLAAVADSEMVIGRNEIAVQYAHDTVRRLMAGEPVHGPREWLGR